MLLRKFARVCHRGLSLLADRSLKGNNLLITFLLDFCRIKFSEFTFQGAAEASSITADNDDRLADIAFKTTGHGATLNIFRKQF